MASRSIGFGIQNVKCGTNFECLLRSWCQGVASSFEVIGTSYVKESGFLQPPIVQDSAKPLHVSPETPVLLENPKLSPGYILRSSS